IDNVAEYANWLTGHLVIRGPSNDQDPSNLTVRTDDAKLEIKRLVAPYCCITPSFQRFDVIGMNPIAEICIALHTSRLESENGRELRGPGDFARAQIPLPDANARPILGQPKSLFAFA